MHLCLKTFFVASDPKHTKTKKHCSQTWQNFRNGHSVYDHGHASMKAFDSWHTIIGWRVQKICHHIVFYQVVGRRGTKTDLHIYVHTSCGVTVPEFPDKHYIEMKNVYQMVFFFKVKPEFGSGCFLF